MYCVRKREESRIIPRFGGLCNRKDGVEPRSLVKRRRMWAEQIWGISGVQFKTPIRRLNGDVEQAVRYTSGVCQGEIWAKDI